MFIIHNDDAPDGSVKIRDYTAIPTTNEVKQFIGQSIPDKHIDLALKSVTDGADGKYEIHNPDGYGGVGEWERLELVLASPVGRSVPKHDQG